MRRPWVLKSIVLGVGLFLLLAIHRVHAISLGDPQAVSGWSLLALVVLLALYNIRKKLSAPPLVASRHWLNIHIYVGLLTIVLFALHINFRIPNGLLEVTLAVLFVTVALTGVIGIILSRLFARALSTRGNEVIYEQIPNLRRNVSERVQALALDSVKDTEATTVADFHASRLMRFLDGPRNFWSHVINSRRPITLLLRETGELKRYLDDRGQETMAQIEELLAEKDSLDYHYALQTVLKGWLFVHIPATYGLVVFIALHVVIVSAFAGNA